MLVISRKKKDSVILSIDPKELLKFIEDSGEHNDPIIIEVQVNDCRGRVVLGFSAPRLVTVVRSELLDVQENDQ